MGYFKKRAFKRAQLKRLKENGVRIEAKIIGVRNKQPYVEFTVKDETIRKVLDIKGEHYGEFTGKLLAVRYDPDYPGDCCAELEIK